MRSIITTILAVGFLAPALTAQQRPTIAEAKRLDSLELAHKPEGRYLTGLPKLESNPVNGAGVGGTLFWFDNGDRTDPLFEYTPYRAQVMVEAMAFTAGRIAATVTFDVPYAFGTRWRLRGAFESVDDPNFQYFGLGARTMDALTFRDAATGAPRTFRRWSAYEENLSQVRGGRVADGENPLAPYTDVHHNEMRYDARLANLGAERSYFGGLVRVLLGYELLHVGVERYDGETVRGVNPQTGNEVDAIAATSRLTQDATDPDEWGRFNITGANGGRIGLFQTGLMFDTRDFEPDPTRGVAVELAQEFAGAWTASEFSFSKYFAQAQAFTPMWTGTRDRRAVLATRAALGTIRGSSIPFTEALDTWSALELGGIGAVGGERSHRGFRSARFAGPAVGYANLELRTRMGRRQIRGQDLALTLVPFLDAGRAWDRLGDVGVSGWKPGWGGGARLAWNQATIIRADLGFSREDTQFFFGFAQTF